MLSSYLIRLQPSSPATASWHPAKENLPGLNAFSKELIDHMDPKNLGMIFPLSSKGECCSSFHFSVNSKGSELMFWCCCRNKNHKIAAPFLPCREIMSSTYTSLCSRTSKRKMFCWTPPNSIYILHIHIYTSLNLSLYSFYQWKVPLL